MSKGITFDFDGMTIHGGTLDGEPILIGREVALALGYADPDKAVRQHCKSVIRLNSAKLAELGLDSPPSGLLMIRDPDVYRLIIRSNLQSAERFEKKVFEEILPTIRKHGAYIDPLANPNYVLEQLAKMIEANNAKQQLEWDRRAEIEEQRRLHHEAKIGELLEGHDPSVKQARNHKTMLQIVMENGVKDKKDRAKLTRALSAGMTKWCRRRGILTQETYERGTILYPISVIPEWLGEVGTAKINAHIARVSGQTVFDFDAEKKKRGPGEGKQAGE